MIKVSDTAKKKVIQLMTDDGFDATTDFVAFGAEISSSIVPDVHNAFDLGSTDKNWRNLHVSGTGYVQTLQVNQVTVTNIDVTGDLRVSGSTFLGNGGDSTVISGSIYNDQLTEKRLVVVGAQGLLTNYSGLTFDNGNLNLSGALEVTNIQGTGSLYLRPDKADGRYFEIYNTAASDVHIKSSNGLSFFGDETNYLKIDDSAQTVTIDSTNGIFLDSNTKVNGTLIVTGTTSLQNTLTVTGTTIIHGNETVNGILTVTGNTQLGGNLYVSGTLEVLGSSTEVHIQSNTVEINVNIILLNAYSPFERYAGIALYDSGSTGESGSFLWDSLNNYFLMNNNSVSSKVVGTTTNTLGNENSLTSTYFPIATGDNTIGNSLLRYSGTTLSFNTNKFTVDSSSGNVYVDGNVRVNGAGGSNYTGYTSEIVFKNSDDDLGFVSSTDTQTVTTQLLGYQSSDGTLVFSSLIDGGSY